MARIQSKDMRIMVFLHGTTIMHKGGIGLKREEIEKRKASDKSVRDFASYVPIGNAPRKLRIWKKEGAEIVYLTSHRNTKDVKKDRAVLRRYHFPNGKIVYRKKGEQYKDIAERIKPHVLIEDDCESIGGKKEMTITHVNPQIKKKIVSVVVKEFEGIDHLPDDIEDFLPLSEETKKAIRQAKADIKAGRLYSFEEVMEHINRKK